ncbi:MAG: Xaa-Pro peptidase family protein [Acidimicrobiales bacterium]|nr:Xaa-Pro peptidase family protein [Acidimicrobiales bacterium]MDP6697493.1 Xaa-Pro peptidase family protein [Acidimicrobiales bacterium]
MFADRLNRARAVMADRGVDVMVLSVGADLPYFCGYEAMPLERLTMLVVPSDGDASLIVPFLEAPRVVERPGVFDVVSWKDGDDAIALAAGLIGAAGTVAVGDQTWAGFLVDLVAELPGVRFSRASEVTAPIRSVKDASEVEALRAAGSAVDRIAAQIQAGEIPLVGRTEAEVSAQIGRRIVEEGHHRVNFAIVASGPNAASPHHEAGDRVIRPGEAVLFDFGGTMADADGVGYCSDITRCVHVGEPAPGFADLYEVLFASHAAGVAAATVGTPCEVVDAAARDVIEHGGYGEFFIHRTGHGIGVEAHEHPNIVVGNDLPLVPGHAFSVEPGIYVPGEWGARLEDIVVAAADGPDAMNLADHNLAVVDG